MDMPIPPKIKPKLSILPPAMKETSIANLMMNPVKKTAHIDDNINLRY